MVSISVTFFAFCFLLLRDVRLEGQPSFFYLNIQMLTCALERFFFFFRCRALRRVCVVRGACGSSQATGNIGRDERSFVNA